MSKLNKRRAKKERKKRDAYLVEKWECIALWNEDSCVTAMLIEPQEGSYKYTNFTHWI
jgi:hypothetical protein